MAIPISLGSGAASIATVQVGNDQYQQVLLSSSNASVISYIQNSSIIANISSSSILAVPVGSTIAVLQSSSILAVPVGSTIAVLQSSSIIATIASSSILAVPVGSTIAYLQAPSIVGTYAEDSAHATGDKGVFSLGVRNDAQPSITSADGDYSPIAVGPTGALIATDAPITKWIQGTADLRVVLGASVTALAAQGASIFTYVREVQVSNFGPSSVLVTFGGGLGSILGYTIAPAGGGSNFVTRLKTGENSAFTASINGTASVLISVQGFTAKI